MTKPALHASRLRSKLKLKQLKLESDLRQRHPQTAALLEKSGLKPAKLRSHAAKLISAGAVAGSLMLASPGSIPALAARPGAEQVTTVNSKGLWEETVKVLKKTLPENYGHLETENEEKVSDFLYSVYKIRAYPELEGNRLNHSYGLMGAEQHLPRFPGDRAQDHGALWKKGVTPGRGAWGYFANSKSELGEEAVQMEKYYFAVQTLYLADWSPRLAYLRDWYKYRKMVAVNTINGKAIVGVVADSGPAVWTGKHFGGSPEVMAYLGLTTGKQKGPVILYFVNDPENRVSLGPLEYNLEAGRLTVPG